MLYYSMWAGLGGRYTLEVVVAYNSVLGCDCVAVQMDTWTHVQSTIVAT